MNEKSQNSTIYEVNIGEDEDQLLKFEKHISEQEVSFFNPKMNISMIFFKVNPFFFNRFFFMHV